LIYQSKLNFVSFENKIRDPEKKNIAPPILKLNGQFLIILCYKLHTCFPYFQTKQNSIYFGISKIIIFFSQIYNDSCWELLYRIIDFWIFQVKIFLYKNHTPTFPPPKKRKLNGLFIIHWRLSFNNLTSARRQTDKFVCLLNVRDKWYQSTNVNKAKSNN
jgi:hypothetical protein